MEPITMIDVTRMLSALAEEYEKKIASLENELAECRAKLATQTVTINDPPSFFSPVHTKCHEYTTTSPNSQLDNSAIPVDKNTGPVFRHTEDGMTTIV